MIITPPPATQSFGFFDNYIKNANHTDLFSILQSQHQETLALIAPLNTEQLNYRYAEGKWNILEIVQHLVDAERNFPLRAMRFSRGEKSVIAPYADIDGFVKASNANGRSIDDLLEEWELLRKATIIQFKTFTPEMLDMSGPFRDVEMTVRALGFAIAGHEMHHVAILKERYLGRQTK